MTPITHRRPSPTIGPAAGLELYAAIVPERTQWRRAVGWTVAFALSALMWVAGGVIVYRVGLATGAW